jgi:hypothetical protein
MKNHNKPRNANQVSPDIGRSVMAAGANVERMNRGGKNMANSFTNAYHQWKWSRYQHWARQAAGVIYYPG